MAHSKIPNPKSKITLLWPWLAAVLSGVAVALAYAPWNQSWLVWIGLAPLLAAIWFGPQPEKRRGLYRLGLAYVTGVVYFWVAFLWITTVTVAGWALLPLYIALFIAPWGWIAGMAGDAEFRRQQTEKVLTNRPLATRPTFSSRVSTCWWRWSWRPPGPAWNGCGAGSSPALVGTTWA
ncbi:MAG: hypothetical protein QM796_07060 [Chthoniobacteraceae bacterium]